VKCKNKILKNGKSRIFQKPRCKNSEYGSLAGLGLIPRLCSGVQTGEGFGKRTMRIRLGGYLRPQQ
jgi:hypothetical protein